jgi:viroplasmin and RNaseH domain-containing protein
MQAQSNDKKRKFYAVAKGRNTGVYSTWTECAAQVNGYKGAMFKSFQTENEAINFVNSVAPSPFTAQPSMIPSQRNAVTSMTVTLSPLKRTQSSIIYSAAEIQAMKTLESLSLYAMYQAHTCNNNNTSATRCEECKRNFKDATPQPPQTRVDPGEKEIEPDDETEFIISDDPQVKRWENNPRFDDESESD